jgi:hypothetical protein
MPRPATGAGKNFYCPALIQDEVEACCKALSNKPDYIEAIAQLETAIAILKTKSRDWLNSDNNS